MPLSFSFFALRTFFLFFFFYCSGAHRDLHSFPTRRSSDLPPDPYGGRSDPRGRRRQGAFLRGRRSEEHTSELQSLTNLVCRLLLEKKKKTKYQTHDQYKKHR